MKLPIAVSICGGVKSVWVLSAEKSVFLVETVVEAAEVAVEEAAETGLVEESPSAELSDNTTIEEACSLLLVEFWFPIMLILVPVARDAGVVVLPEASTMDVWSLSKKEVFSTVTEFFVI